jgi:SAM-dependent methyltransferase
VTGWVIALFLLGPLVIVPLGLWLVPAPPARRSRYMLRAARQVSLPAGMALAVAFVLPPGAVAGLLAVPWLAVAGLGAFAALLDVVAGARDGRLARVGVHHGAWAALAFLPVAAANALADRLGVAPFGFAPLIIMLTAVHFTFAGFILVLVGTLAHAARPGRVSGPAVAAVVIGIPITAIGFFGVAAAALVGALLVAAGGLGVGATLLRGRRSAEARSTTGLWLGRLAGASLLVSMPLAAAYALGTFLGTGWLDLPTMARTHGALNVLGFALPAVVALAVERIATTAPVGGPARPVDVLGFNVAPVVIAPVVGVIALAVALAPLPLPLRFALALAGLAAIVLTIGAIATVWWVFGRSGRRWTWVLEQAGQPQRWLNVTTGFDDSSALLRRSLGGQGRSIDVVDPSLELERPLLRARRRFPPPGAPVVPGTVDAAIEPHGNDVVFLLMAAHEAHGSARADLLRSAARAVTPGGRLILVEHLRDAANILAFGPGAWHFSPRDAWIAATHEAGLRLVDETRLSPFVAGFVLTPDPDQGAGSTSTATRAAVTAANTGWAASMAVSHDAMRSTPPGAPNS